MLRLQRSRYNGVYFVRRLVTSNMTEKIEMTENFVDRSIDRSQILKKITQGLVRWCKKKDGGIKAEMKFKMCETVK